MNGSGIRFVAYLWLTLLAGGCAGNRLDRPYAEGRLLEVARLFEADSALQTQEGALHRAGLVYALPESPAYDPARAIEVFERLLALYPTSSHRSQVSDLLQLLRATHEAGELLLQRESEIAAITAQLMEMRVRLLEVEELLEEESVRAIALQAIADGLNREIQARNHRIRELEEERAGLMEIDLNRPSAQPAAPVAPP